MVDSAFTYYLGGKHRFNAITLATRSGEPADVLTFYYDDPELLTTPSCAAAMGWGSDTEIVNSSPEHLAGLHRVDDPLAVHAHIKKPRCDILASIAVLLSRHMNAVDVGHHVQQFDSAWKQLIATPEVAGLSFVADPDSYVYNQCCTDLHRTEAIDRGAFISIPDC